MGLTALTCGWNWHRTEPQPGGPHRSQAASASATPDHHTGTDSNSRATPAQRAIFLAGRTVRQLPPAMFNVACNVGLQSAALAAAKKLLVRAKIALPWGASLSGQIGVSGSKEFFGELAENFGPRLALPGSNSRWWPYSTQALIARLSSGIVDAGFYTLGVVIGSGAGKNIIAAHGVTNGAGTDASQALMEILQDLGNGELIAFLGPNGACDWGHRITEGFIIACMPDAKYDFQFCRKPEWKNFFVRFGLGMFSRVVVTGLCSSGWLSAIASENQAGYMVGGAYSASVPAVLRVAQPIIRDMLYQAYLTHSGAGAEHRRIDEEAMFAVPALEPVENTGDFIEFRPAHGEGQRGPDDVAGQELATLVVAAPADAEARASDLPPPPAPAGEDVDAITPAQPEQRPASAGA